MDLEKLVRKRMERQKWIIPAGFGLTCFVTVLGIALVVLRNFQNLDIQWSFSLGADVFCMAVCVMLYLSCLLAQNERGEYTQVFSQLLTLNAMALFLDECCWLLQGVPETRTWNLIANVLYYANGAVLIYFFYRYVANALNMEGRIMRAANALLNILLIPTLVLCFVNLFYPIYFEVDAAGVYRRTAGYPYSQIFLTVGLICVILGLILSKAPLRQKLVALSFVAIPMVGYVLTMNAFGVTTSYAATLVSVVLIYGVLFADRERAVAATGKELALATRIQSDMLPNIFPAFPERPEFDVFASMTPAKEVGGDFYDFFLVDDDHLGLVMADVSGKGVPAALFMMIAKILVQNYAMTGRTPAQVLESVNTQICQNNHEEMFVTVWFGILDLKTGLLTAANAGHEYPVLQRPGGDFEIVRDKHGFVIGGMSGMRYKEYELQLEPGSGLFLYTDGVPEATNAEEELFGMERTLAALNSSPDGTPKTVLETVSSAVQAFVGDAPQFDDLTMLCLQYRGPAEKEKQS